MSSAAKYFHDDCGGDSERPALVCAEAGRRCVRSIHLHPILSPDWIQMVDALRQLTRLIKLEGRMPSNAKISEIQGRDPESQGTLWDQETQENIIRILVEEAKINLCLRILFDFKKWQYDPPQRQATIDEVMQAFQYTESQVDVKCRQFEESMGQLLGRSLMHVEALQLLDIHLLIEHLALVLKFCDREMEEKLECTAKGQELIVLYYVASMFRHAEALNNAELLARIRDFKLLHLVVSHVVRHASTEYCKEVAHEVALGLACLADNEDFKTDWKKFFEDPHGRLNVEELQLFLRLQSEFVEPMLASHPEKCKELRPLTDFFGTIKRNLKA